MAGRWELTEEQWAVVEPVLRGARRADNRGRPWHDTRSVLNGVFWVLGTGAQWRELPEKYPPYQTCHRRFQQWTRSGKLEEALKLLARLLYEQGKLNLEEAFVDATFASAKKGALPWVRPVAARAPKSSLSPLITVFLSPYLCKALRLPQTMEGRAALRLDAQLPPPRHPMGISHRELSRLRPPRLPSYHAQVFMRPLLEGRRWQWRALL
jgi:transposase